MSDAYKPPLHACTAVYAPHRNGIPPCLQNPYLQNPESQWTAMGNIGALGACQVGPWIFRSLIFGGFRLLIFGRWISYPLQKTGSTCRGSGTKVLEATRPGQYHDLASRQLRWSGLCGPRKLLVGRREPMTKKVVLPIWTPTKAQKGVHIGLSCSLSTKSRKVGQIARSSSLLSVSLQAFLGKKLTELSPRTISLAKPPPSRFQPSA